MPQTEIELFMEELNQRQVRQKIENYRRLNRFVKPGQVVFTGSSLMEQFPLNELLQGENLPFLVYNRGIGGFVTSQLMEVLDVCVSDLRPAHVFINIGTNDMNGPEYSLTEMMARYESILRKIQQDVPGVKLHLLAYYPVNPDAAGDEFIAELLRFRTNDVLAQANRAAEDLARRVGADFFDLNAPLKDEKSRLNAAYTVEGMHLYADGYKAVLGELLPILRGLEF